MKILTIISLVLSLNANIYMPLYKNAQNQTGNNDYAYFAQASYNYTNENPVDIIGTQFMPLIYRFNIVINFKEPVKHAVIHMLLTQPQSNAYDLNYVSEFCTINYTASNYEFEITANNTNVCYITLIFSYKMLKDMYGYDWLEDNTFSPQQDEWVQNGDTYININTLQLKSVILPESTEHNYNSQLNSLIANTDTIEQLLTNIQTNTAYLSTISSNINAIKNTLTTMSNNLLVSNNLQKVMNAAEMSNRFIINNISNMFDYHYEELDTTLFTQNGGNVLVFDINDESYADFDRNNLKFVCQFNNGYGLYLCVPIPLPKEKRPGPGGLVNNQQNEYFFRYSADGLGANVYQYGFLITYNLDEVYLRLSIYYLNVTNQTSNSLTWTSLGNQFIKMYITDAPIFPEEINFELLKAIQNINNLDIISDPNENTVDNFYDTLKQNMNLPTLPAIDNDIIKKVKSVISPLTVLLNSGELEIYKYFTMFGIFSMLFGVIFL